MRMRGPPKIILISATHFSKAKVIWKSFELDPNASQACLWFYHMSILYIYFLRVSGFPGWGRARASSSTPTVTFTRVSGGGTRGTAGAGTHTRPRDISRLGFVGNARLFAIFVCAGGMVALGSAQMLSLYKDRCWLINNLPSSSRSSRLSNCVEGTKN